MLWRWLPLTQCEGSCDIQQFDFLATSNAAPAIDHHPPHAVTATTRPELMAASSAAWSAVIVSA